MLVNSNEILKKAKKDKYAVPQFNINNLEWTKYALEECNRNNMPVILGVSEGAAKYMGGYKVVSNLVKGLIEDLNIKVDVVLHLDHGSSYEACVKAINAGFTSVMIDASKKELEENIKITKKVVEYAKQFNVSTEAEIGHIGGSEDGVEGTNFNARLDECIELIKATKVDSLAPALGSVHGLYKGEPNLDFKTMKEINDNIEQPLVLHGGTGIPDYQIKEAISCGISKININTELQISWSNEVRLFIESNKDVYDPRKIIGSGEKKIKETISKKIEEFLNK